MSNEQAHDLEELLDQIKDAENREDAVSFDAILDEIGHRSFGPQILLAGLIASAPVVGDIPGVPTTMGVYLVLVVSQIFFRQDYIWLPDWILERSVERKKLEKTLDWLQKPARYIDKILRPRMTYLVNGTGTKIIAVICLITGFLLPFGDFVLFAGNVIGAAITLFGLALIARDGLLALIGYVITLGSFILIITTLL